ncbi:sorting nexin-5-like isoform X1 [Dreissena polymorpha]|uniref:sorting nexin-5-like isoform X1 n=1 Tax=Dreissena polymorpha TaxID=45954 RepID=UPI002264B8BB|nr:sorting nexin-5-like isoform X1 [Dreissena polymorpha]
MEDATSSPDKPDDDVDLSSPDSSPTRLPFVPFNPPFRVTVPEAIKNGEVLQFTIKVYKWDEDQEVSEVTRDYGDVEWLHHNIITQNNIDGIIVPPLPNRPEVDAKSAESKSKKQLGSDSRIVIPDEFSRDCRQIEKYLRMLLAHESFGKDKNLETFLCEKEAAIKAQVKHGFFSRMSSAVETARKEHHRDIDEFFSKKREWSINYSKAIKDTCSDFNKMVNAQHRLAGSYASFSLALQQGGVNRDLTTETINKYLTRLSDATDNTKHGLEVLCKNDERTLGFQLDLYVRYIDSVKDMLFRRTCLLVEYEDANRALDKAKPAKRKQAEEQKESAEAKYEMCCDNARREFKTYLQTRMLAYQDGMVSYVESQIKTARDTYTLLAKTMTQLKQAED